MLLGIVITIIVVVIVIGSLYAVGVFTPKSSSSSRTYTVTFTEGGLPSGTSWSVTLRGTTQSSTSSSIAFTEANGTYAFTVGAVSGYTASPSSGSVTVNGAAVSKAVTFTAVPPSAYAVTFTESGLPSGTSWSVTLNGTTSSATAPGSITFTEANGTYAFSVGAVSGYTASPSSGSVTVNGAAVSKAVTFTAVPPGAYPVTFSQTGLPGDVGWSALLLIGAYGSTTFPAIAGTSGEGPSFEFAVPNGKYFFFVQSENSSYLPTPEDGNITVASAPVSVSIVFTVVTPTATHYPVTFTETGLPSGTTWSVYLHGDNFSAPAGSPIGFSEPNGTYYYSVSTIAAGYAATIPSGDVVVNGHGVTVSVRFIHVYPVTFTETGLSATATWQVRLNETESSESAGYPITFSVPNGSYPYTVSASGYTATPASGTVTVSGASVSVAITFTAVAPPSMHNVTFTESGLPSGTFWTISVFADGLIFMGYGNYSPTTTLTVSVPNGNYTWVFVGSGARGYLPTPFAGGFAVKGGPVSQSLTFTYSPSDRIVAFSEYSYWFSGKYGIPNGTSWTVALGGATQSSAGMFIVFLEPNGTYSYTITPPAGYVAVPSSGTFTVNSSYPAEFFSSSASVFVVFLSSGGPGAASPAGGAENAPVGPIALASLIAVSAARPGRLRAS